MLRPEVHFLPVYSRSELKLNLTLLISLSTNSSG